MAHPALAALFALFCWWFSTGLIIYLDGLPRRTFRWSMIGATLLLGISLYGLAITSREATLANAYWAFACGLLAWGWQEISFYMGFVTGPRREACREGCGGWRHFGHAVQTSLYHELAIVAVGALVVALTWRAPNQVGTWTFMILWWMHQSAKLNVFLGVRNLNEEFLPEHLAFLKGFLTKKPMNLLFPLSITLSTVIATVLVTRAATAASPFGVVGDTFLATMMVLAILEHWFLVLPLPSAKLWSWGLASRRPAAAFDAEIVAGFLGAGKTTLLRRMLADADPAIRTVVLVNDFAAMGLDGSLLSGQGAGVVELPNGCICCSLRGSLSRQLHEAIARWSPQRVLIEPSGVADLAALVGVLHGPDLAPLTRRLEVTGVVDAGAFLADYARMPGYFEAQARLANRIVVSKCDLATPAELHAIGATLRGLNPTIALVGATFGRTAPRPELLPAVPAPKPLHDHANGHDHAHAHPPEHADAGAPATARHADPHPHRHADGAADHDHAHAHPVPDLQSCSRALGAPCDAGALEALLADIAAGTFGSVERVKGIARVGGGWIRFDLAGGRPCMTAFAPHGDEQPRVVAIGRAVNEERLLAAFDACECAAAA
ncbi:MAG TPA: putative photosynthetic complex assembly protein PuhE [Acetobacteraceae bacterium]|nr:putative photosynthetic complex assembly protein PuhE [Acetobacteraceae bacterium]